MSSDAKMFEIDSRIGLNGSQCHWRVPSMYDKDSQRFYVWLGDVSIDKVTKSTFLNIVSFAQNCGATEMVLV
jgi:hypothetical protein